MSTSVNPEDDEPRARGSSGDDADGGDDGGGGDDEIEILEVEAADEAGVRLPKSKARGRKDKEPELDVEVDLEDEPPAASPGAEAASSQLQAQLQEMREQLLRTAADFDNFRKRVERDRVEERKQATAGLVRNMLPALDSFRWALSQAEKSEEPAVKGFLEGFRLIETQLFDILKGAGLEPVDASGAFDPAVHEALMQETTTEAPHMSVLEVFEPGWRLGGRLLRPARVKVANNPGAAPTAGGDDGEVPPETESATTH